MNLYGALTWIYRRIGQMTCFSLGGGLAMTSGMSSTDGPMPQIIMAGIFLATGLILRHQHLKFGPR